MLCTLGLRGGATGAFTLPSELICSSSTTFTVGSPLIFPRLTAFPLRAVLNTFGRTASTNFCKHSQGTQQHYSLLSSTASVFLVTLFPSQRVVPPSPATSHTNSKTARFFLFLCAHTSTLLLDLLPISILVPPHRATMHNVVVFPSTVVDVLVPCTDPNEITRSCPHRT